MVLDYYRPISERLHPDYYDSPLLKIELVEFCDVATRDISEASEKILYNI